ncbi:glycosyltransferase involved in cell wall biosynthesis [Bradyrhizobium diazoefficiens]|uniref:glycosyltransferase family 4 protein n=1 Tax=Bradyrhizobium diazoefficiens TaxID=1355477 RepID=UPI001B8D326D|nr:glycosyltransferase family 4 protein [Bradyrhizobium diazoefficiens]MBR0860525.1 glycosyltransferase family 4 protein [Bradyrhizobium diazoefficiens]MBR0885016.1 glycosyltransferase family 4 protein [Bradyrhizobium diazoefficiens]MBR0916920.1 glycosyltransferase family 4 protein [Bradyrhizobium diazoefficiens]
MASFRPMPTVRSTKEAVRRAVAFQEASETLPPDALLTSLDRAAETLDLSTIKPTTEVAVKPRRIMTVATEWSSAHGGLSTLNRELCIALAAAGHSVVCLVIEPAQREIDDAKAARVRLIGCPSDPAIEGTGRLLLFHPSQLAGYTPEVVIGHDHITGSAAQHIAHRLYGVPNVHFVHTLPEEIEIYKSRSENGMLRGAEKAEVQYRQCLSAQLVVGVGPRIHHEMSTKITPNSDVPVVVMRPGLDRRLLEYEVDLSKPRRPQCLFLARLEDGELKGAGLACQMICSLNTNWSWTVASRPRLIVRGFNPAPEKFEKEIAAIGGFKEAIQYLIPRPFAADAETVAGDIRSASAIIMPSKREGFGLTALEGISAGIPVIVSSESGLAWLLLESDVQAAIGTATADACVADVDGKSEDICKDWATRAQTILSDPTKAFSQAKQMRRALIPLLSWEKAALKFSNDLESILGTDTELAVGGN